MVLIFIKKIFIMFKQLFSINKSAIYYACTYNLIQEFKFFMEYDIDLLDDLKKFFFFEKKLILNWLLHYLIKNNYEEIFKILIENEFNINIINKKVF